MIQSLISTIFRVKAPDFTLNFNISTGNGLRRPGHPIARCCQWPCLDSRVRKQVSKIWGFWEVGMDLYAKTVFGNTKSGWNHLYCHKTHTSQILKMGSFPARRTIHHSQLEYLETHITWFTSFLINSPDLYAWTPDIHTYLAHASVGHDLVVLQVCWFYLFSKYPLRKQQPNIQIY